MKKLVALAVKVIKHHKRLPVARHRKLQEEHIQYLLAEDTINSWAHLSLKQRVKMFHRRFPELKISASTLHRAYKSHGVKYKYIQRVKKVIDYSQEHYSELFKKMKMLLDLVKL